MGHLADVCGDAHRHTSLQERHRKESLRKVQDRITTGPHSLRCPFCEVYELERTSNGSAHCPSCGAVLGGVLLETLRQITELPLVIGQHACECGHPEMRCLPDGVYRCPACASEVTPISYPA
jgi:ribosomal protein L37AE/L43A